MERHVRAKAAQADAAAAEAHPEPPRCAMQDDVLPGRLRDWLTLPVLAHHDVVSPLPRPFASCGPFMVCTPLPALTRPLATCHA